MCGCGDSGCCTVLQRHNNVCDGEDAAGDVLLPELSIADPTDTTPETKAETASSEVRM